MNFPDMIGQSARMLGFGMPGQGEWLVIILLGLLIFGRRLPEVARSIGSSVTEFKRGIRSVTDEIEREVSHPVRERASVTPQTLPRNEPVEPAPGATQPSVSPTAHTTSTDHDQ